MPRERADAVSTHRPTQHEDAALDTAAIAIRIMEAFLNVAAAQPALAGKYWELFGVFSSSRQNWPRSRSSWRGSCSPLKPHSGATGATDE